MLRKFLAKGLATAAVVALAAHAGIAGAAPAAGAPLKIGTPVYTRLMTAPQLRQALGLK